MKKWTAFLSGLRRYRGNSLLVRSTLATFAAVILVLSIVLSMAYNIARKVVEDSVLEMNRVITERSIDSINAVLDESARIGAALSLEESTRRFMLHTGEYPSELIKTLALECSTYPMIFNYLHSIYLYCEQTDYILSPAYSGTAAAYADTTWRAGYDLAREDRVYAVSRARDGGYPYFLTVVLPYYFYQGQKSGALFMNIDMDKLDKLLLGIGNLAEQTVAVTDEHGRVLYCNNRALFQTPAEEDVILRQGAAALGSTFIHTGEDGARTVITSARLTNRGWSLISALPLTFYDSSFARLQGRMQQLIVLVAIVGIALTLLLSIRSYLPVRGIIRTLEATDAPVVVPGRPVNEADYIRQAIAASAKSNQRMRLELDDRLRLLREAQASALQAQITPHFLSNTLDAIRWGAIEMGGGENEVSRMLTVLSALLRTSLDMENALVTIEEEIDHCRLYLEIMKYRYNADIDVTWEIPEALRRTRIAKLTFQPLLENALQHGLRPKKMQGCVRVQGTQEGGRVVIRFTDSGVGIAGDRLAHMNWSMGSETALTGSHIGMHNVNQRLKLLFGVAYGLRVSSVEGSETVIELVIPAEED